jgi:hypothetical protein
MFLKIEFSETEVDYASYQSITRFSKKGIYFSILPYESEYESGGEAF